MRLMVKIPYLIAEIGINHNGDLQIAKKLIDAAFACSWDCVKFQKRFPDICVPESIKYEKRDTPWGRLTYLEYRKKMEFGKEEYDYINNYCKEKPIDWTASVWDLESLEFIMQYPVPFIKIPSALITDLTLVKEAAKTGKPVYLSTGMSTMDEVIQAVEILEKYAKKYILLHTNSSYPSPYNEINLKIIRTLQGYFGCEVGYSGHEEGLEPTVAAVVYGATVIERHITIDHNLWGSGHKASLEPHAMFMLKNRIKDVCEALGNGVKTVTKSELEIKRRLRRI